jgi:hypothetical protein
MKHEEMRQTQPYLVSEFNAYESKYTQVTLAKDRLDAQIFNTIITILYMYMFRTISCLSSGRQIALMQHLVSSLSVSDRAS